MLIDTHCHLTDRYVPADAVGGVISRARDAGVGAMVVACADPNDPASAIALCERHDNLFCTVGIHPEYAGRCQPDYKKFLSHPRVVGVGEIGLDYHRDSAITESGREPPSREAQIELFRAQLEIACEVGLPVAIHSRAARPDTVDILRASEYEKLGGDGVPGVMHFHCMPWEWTEKLLDRGFYFSATGIITFKNADTEREVFRKLPLDRIVVETDAPWCAPVPHRGKTCEPAMVVETARVLADLHNIPLPELENILFENTKRLYPKMAIHVRANN